MGNLLELDSPDVLPRYAMRSHAQMLLCRRWYLHVARFIPVFYA